MKPTLIITGVVAVLLLLGFVAGVGDTTSSSPYSSSGSSVSDSSSGYSSSDDYSSDDYSSDDYSTDGSSDYGGEDPQSLALNWPFALMTLAGLLCLAAVFVPTMPRTRQFQLGGLGLVATVYGIWVWQQDSGTYTYTGLVVVAPLLVVGWAGYGWYQNVQRGEGARGSLDDTGDPGPELVFPAALRHASRASFGLDVDVDAPPAAVRDAVGRALASRGNYFVTGGCAYAVLRHRPDGLDCAILSDVRGVQQCTFAVRLAGTRLSVRLVDYRTVTEKLFLVIPMGPATIPGLASYRHFLRTLAREARRADRGAGARVVQA